MTGPVAGQEEAAGITGSGGVPEGAAASEPRSEGPMAAKKKATPAKRANPKPAVETKSATSKAKKAKKAKPK